jgi:hypothetical protein
MPFGATADAAQAAANGHCNSSAAAGNLPGHYVAWLSTSTTNAIEKLGSANGWVRTDGRPFANAQADLAAGRIFYPPRVSENGSEVGIQLVAATGTGREGTVLAGRTCNDWTSTAGYAGAGWPSGGSQAWTNAASVSPCSGPFVLYCLETSRSVPVVAAATGRTAFVSTGLFAPGPGRNRASADAMCQSEALAAGLPGPSGNYLALLALDGERPLARFSIDPGLPTWVRPDGVQLVASASQIVNSTLLAPIDVTAERTYLTYVTGGITWTGSLGPNLPGDLASTCNNWGSSEGSGHGGDIERTFLWVNEFQSSIDCHGAARVFCFQQ